MAFRLQIIKVGKSPYLTEFDETPRFWYLRVAHDAWIDFYSQTVEIRQSKCQKNLPFCFSLLFLSLYPILLSLPCLLSLIFFLFFYFLSSLIYPPFLILFVPSLSLFISFHFLFSFFLFSSFFSFLLLASPTHMDKWGKLPPHFLPWPLVITKFFFLIFFILFFPFITSCNTWLNVKHLL